MCEACARVWPQPHCCPRSAPVIDTPEQGGETICPELGFCICRCALLSADQEATHRGSASVLGHTAPCCLAPHCGLSLTLPSLSQAPRQGARGPPWDRAPLPHQPARPLLSSCDSWREDAPTLSCQGPREGQLVRATGIALEIHRKL